jgi:hypothetical protein
VSNRLEYVVVSVMLLLDAIDRFVESATDTRTDSLPKDGDSPAPEAISERSDGRERIGERGGRIGGTSSRSLVPVGVSYPSTSTAPPKDKVLTSLEDEETNSRLADRNVGRPTPTAEDGDGDDVHCCLVLFRVVRGECGEFCGDGECECADADADKLGEDMTAREGEVEEKEEPVRYGEPRGGGIFTTREVLIGFRIPPLPREIRE